MRRSGAPSVRKQCNANNLSDTKSTPLVPIQQNHPSSSNATNKPSKFWSCVWGKRSTKKHKTFEDDGTLEITTKLIKLRDSCGKYLGTTNIPKDNAIENGTLLTVGSYEIEIGEPIENFPINSLKRSTEDDDEMENNYKRTVKKPACLIPKMVLSNSSSIATGPIFNFKLSQKIKTTISNPLIMPEPNVEHQWKFNESRHPIQQVSVIDTLVHVLRSHQRDGVVFLYECLTGLRNPDYFGCILADEMGLGKTLQCLAACYTMLKQGPYGSSIAKKILIVTPSSLTDNWNNEITKWLGKCQIFSFQMNGKHNIQHFSAAPHLPFMICSYEMFAKHFEELKNIEFDIIVCDEGHRLKNINLKATQLFNQMPCKRRVLLTGTPIQNDLQEFYALMNFVNPGLLGTYPDYRNNFEIPIVQSQRIETSSDKREFGEKQATELTRITNQFMLRRTQQVIRQFLPKKQEFIIFCKPSALQRYLFQQVAEYLENTAHLDSQSQSSFQIISILKKICNHPSLVQLSEKDNPLRTILNAKLPTWETMSPDDSTKLFIVQDLLSELIEKNEKVVIISYYTKTLDMIQGLLEHFQYSFCRLDGKTSTASRDGIVRKFNNPNEHIFVFLLSAKAGGVGLNLIGASRLILFDNDWNPASDLQAISRIWRDGQKKNVLIYRLITTGTIEEKIFQRQMFKSMLSGCIIDRETTPKKHGGLQLSDEELKDLFSFQENYDFCETHTLLDCDCFKDEQNVTSTVSEPSTSSGCQISLHNDDSQRKTLKMHQLSKWEHLKKPIDQSLLNTMCIPNTSDDIVFIFRNQYES